MYEIISATKRVEIKHVITWHIFISCQGVNTGSVTAISTNGQISEQKSDNTISHLSINISMNDFFHIRTVIIPQPISIIHISLVWEVNFVLFNSMLKYLINRKIINAFFHLKTVIIRRLISTLWLKPSGQYRCLWR